MLAVSRTEVLAYLEALGQAFREDSSNRDLRLTRNRIRHELLPTLARNHNPGIVGILVQLAEQAEEIFTIIEADAQRLLTEAELPRAGRLLIFDQNCLGKAPRHLVRDMFRLAWTREGWPTGDMDFAAWDRLASVAYHELAAVDLPGEIRARVKGKVVQLGLGW
jgi:tRNA(Ile)-lysidine synthase